MSADKDRGIRRQKQKRAKAVKQAAKRAGAVASSPKTPSDPPAKTAAA